MVDQNEQIKEDPRFQEAKKEMIITILFWLFAFVLTAVLAFSLLPADPARPSLVAGLPSFVFWAGIIAPIIVVTASYIVGQYIFKDSSLDAYEEGE